MNDEPLKNFQEASKKNINGIYKKSKVGKAFKATHSYLHDIIDFILEFALVSMLFCYKLLAEKNAQWYAYAIAVIVTFVLIILLITIKRKRRHINENLNQRLRVCLLNIRTLFVSTSQIVYDLSRNKPSDLCYNLSCNYPSIHSKCYLQRISKQIKHNVLEKIYHQLSINNQDLSKIYRVSLFEPFDDEYLKIVAFANNEKFRPKSRSLNTGFRKREGLVGYCWYYGIPISISNVYKYVSKNVNKPNFAFKILDQYSQINIGSIVCYPIINRLLDKEKIEAILCIDCDQVGEFDIYNPKIAKEIRIEIFPYIRFLCLFYSIINYFLSKLSSDADCSCPLSSPK